MTLVRILCSAVFLCSTHWARAMCVDENKPLPMAALNDHQNSGEIVYRAAEDLLHYQPWSSTSLTGQIHVVYHLAARHGVDTLNKKFIEALENLPPHSYRLVVILNIDDVFTGGRYLARKTFEKNVRKNSNHVTFVLDNDSRIKRAWCLKDQSSTILVLDQKGYIMKAKDGALHETEIQDYTQQIQQQAKTAPNNS